MIQTHDQNRTSEDRTTKCGPSTSQISRSSKNADDGGPVSRLRGDDRAVSATLGMLLMVAITLVLYTTAQTAWGPQVRASTDYTHARNVLTDMQNVRADTVQAGQSGYQQGSVLQMGSNYPEYLILIQPPGPSGTLQTTDERDISITDVHATNPEAEQYFEEEANELSFQTQSLVYNPNYAEYDDAPETVLSNTVLYEDYGENKEVIANPSLISGRRISLSTTIGDISRGQTRPLLVQSQPLSASQTAVRVNADSDGDGNPNGHIKLRIQTELSEETWRKILSDEIDSDTSKNNPATDDDGQFIAEIEKSGDTLILHLENEVSYRLNMAKIGYKTGYQPSFAEEENPDAKYLSAESNRKVVVNEGNKAQLTVQVRDGFNNPVADKQVFVETYRQRFGRPEKLSGGDGTVTFTYTAPDDVENDQTTTVTIKVEDVTGDKSEVEFTVIVQNTD